MKPSAAVTRASQRVPLWIMAKSLFFPGDFFTPKTQRREKDFRIGLRPLVRAVAFLCLFAAQAQSDPNTRSFEFSYVTEVGPIPADSTRLDVWLPCPKSDEQQEITGFQVESPYPTQIRQEEEYDNSVLHLGVDKPQQPFRVTMRFQVRRKEFFGLNSGPEKNHSNGNGSDRLLKRFLLPDALVPIDGRVKEWAIGVVDGEKSDIEKARGIYDYTVGNLKYDKSGTGWGQGNLYYACDARRGNCTDFHAVFIGFNRAVGVPAKFEIGFPLPQERGEGQIQGYHCWAEFYASGRGWIPVDCSEACKNPTRKEYFFGALDENRVLFTVGRDLLLVPPQKGARLNFFIYPYAELDGKVFPGVKKQFFFKDLP